MNLIKYIKKRILFFLVAFIIMFPFCYSKNEIKPHAKSESYNNAYLACFIDDTSFMYKTQVLYSGNYIEAYRISNLFQYTDDRPKKYDIEAYCWETQSSLFLDEPSERVAIHGFCNYIDGASASSTSYAPPTMDLTQDYVGFDKAYLRLSINDENGQFSIVSNVNSDITSTKVPLSYIKWKGGDKSKYLPKPLTFPAKGGATEADINRAYEVQEAIGDDFRDALLFINDSQAFTSTDALIETAYKLLICQDEAMIVNQYGSKFKIDFGDGTSGGYEVEGSNGYLYYVKISKLDSSGEIVSTSNFNFKIKKGYTNCTFGETMENGSRNGLNNSDYDEAVDTTYISWEQLFVEAGILYAEGVSYSNQGDIFTIDSLQSSLVSVVRDTFLGIKNILQLYDMEDCVFNQGIRGSNAFVHGIYYDNWSPYISLFFMVFIVIALAFVIISLIRIVLKKQLGTISPSARFSMAESIKDLILALFIISSTWILIKFIVLLNGRFVNIWGEYVNGRTLVDTAMGYSTLASLIYQITYFIILIYVNYVYILRGVVVPALIITAPFFIIAYSFGEGGKRLSKQWFRELLGNIFIQSIHAFVYGLILVMSFSLRGIEGIVLCSAFIPLTSIYKSILQIGGDEMLKKAQGLTGLTTAGIGTAIGVGGAVAGKAIGVGAGAIGGVAGGAVGGVLGESVGNAVGNISETVGNVVGSGVSGIGSAYKMSMGAGLSLSTGDSQGMMMMNDGARGMQSSVTSAIDSVGNTFSPQNMSSMSSRAVSNHKINKEAKNVNTLENKSRINRNLNQMNLSHLGTPDAVTTKKGEVTYKFSNAGKNEAQTKARERLNKKIQNAQDLKKNNKDSFEMNTLLQKHNASKISVEDGVISVTFNNRDMENLTFSERMRQHESNNLSFSERMRQHEKNNNS